MVHPPNKILLRNKQEETDDTCNNVNESEMHYASEKKSDSNSYIFISQTVSRLNILQLVFLVSEGYHNKIPQIGGLKTTILTFIHFYSNLYMIFCKKQNDRPRGGISGCSRLGEEGGFDCKRAAGGNCWGDVSCFLHPSGVKVAQLYALLKSINCTLRRAK